MRRRATFVLGVTGALTVVLGVLACGPDPCEAELDRETACGVVNPTATSTPTDCTPYKACLAECDSKMSCDQVNASYKHPLTLPPPVASCVATCNADAGL